LLDTGFSVTYSTYSEAFQVSKERVRGSVSAGLDTEGSGPADRLLFEREVGVFWRSRILELSE